MSHLRLFFFWSIDEHTTKSRCYAVVNELSDSYRGACSPLNFTMLLPDWGWFFWAKYKTEGRKGGGVYLHGGGRQGCSGHTGTWPSPGEPFPCVAAVGKTTLGYASAHHAWFTPPTSSVAGKIFPKKKQRKKQNQTNKKKKQHPKTPRRYYLAQWENWNAKNC